MAKVDTRRVALEDALADAIEDAFEEWERAQAEAANWDYPEDYPLIRRLSAVRYVKPYRRSQSVVLGSRSTAHG